MRVTVDGLAEAVMEGLEEYSSLASSDVKTAVRKAGSTIRREIRENAPEKTGAYSKSWSVKTVKETSNSLEITVYSRNRYQLAHLLEKGHAKRGGGRVAARVHIAPAEKKGTEELVKEIERSLSHG